MEKLLPKLTEVDLCTVYKGHTVVTMNACIFQSPTARSVIEKWPQLLLSEIHDRIHSEAVLQEGSSKPMTGRGVMGMTLLQDSLMVLLQFP
jgi:hypothetical protein